MTAVFVVTVVVCKKEVCFHLVVSSVYAAILYSGTSSGRIFIHYSMIKTIVPTFCKSVLLPLRPSPKSEVLRRPKFAAAFLFRKFTFQAGLGINWSRPDLEKVGIWQSKQWRCCWWCLLSSIANENSI